MPTLCSKPKNGILVFLDFGSVDIGVHFSVWRPRRTPGSSDFGRGLFRDFPFLQAGEPKLAGAAIWNPRVGFASRISPRSYRIEE